MMSKSVLAHSSRATWRRSRSTPSSSKKRATKKRTNQSLMKEPMRKQIKQQTQAWMILTNSTHNPLIKQKSPNQKTKARVELHQLLPPLQKPRKEARKARESQSLLQSKSKIPTRSPTQISTRSSLVSSI